MKVFFKIFIFLLAKDASLETKTLNIKSCVVTGA
jgi:hypothetical protein